MINCGSLLYLLNLTSATVKWRHKCTDLGGDLVVRNQVMYAKSSHSFLLAHGVQNKCFLLVLPLPFYKNLHHILKPHEMEFCTCFRGSFKYLPCSPQGKEPAVIVCIMLVFKSQHLPNATFTLGQFQSFEFSLLNCFFLFPHHLILRVQPIKHDLFSEWYTWFAKQFFF